MGGIAKGLFGSAPKAKTSAQPTMTKEQLKLLKELMGVLTPQVGEITDTIGGYEGPFTAPLNNLQSLSLESLENLSREMGSSATYQQADESLQKMLQTGGKQDITDTFEKSILNPTLKTFTEQTIPGVIGNFGGMGAYGSDRQKQQQIALRNLNDSVLSAGAKLAYDAGDSANKNILAALGLTPAIQNLPLDALVKSFGVGAMEQGVRQAGIGTELDYVRSQNEAKARKLEALLASLGLKSKENISTVTGGSSGLLSPVLGGIAASGGFNSILGL